MQTNTHIGRILKPFELQFVGQKKTEMVRFGMAVKRFMTKSATTDFIYYVAFGKTAEMLYKYANKKGMPVEIRFTIQSEMYNGRDGQSHYKTTNLVDSFMPWAGTSQHQDSDPYAAQNMQRGTDLTAPDSPLDIDEYSGGLADVLPDDYNVL